MKKFILILFSLVLSASYGQKEKKSDIKVRDGIFNANFTLDTKLTNRLSIENGIRVRYNFDAKSIELPLHFKYRINQKLNVFTGLKVYRTANINRYGNLLNSARFGTSGQIGIQYDFIEDVYAKTYFERNFNATKNSNLGLNNVYNGVNFKFGYRF